MGFAVLNSNILRAPGHHNFALGSFGKEALTNHSLFFVDTREFEEFEYHDKRLQDLHHRKATILD